MLIADAITPADALLRSFIDRITDASEVIRRRSKKALLVLLFDAADNAEMAARQLVDDRCFASMLIRVKLPSNFRVVFLCRTERRSLLKPPLGTIQLALKPFSLVETSRHLKSRYSKSGSKDAEEFRRLTGGNPRVQANCLSFKHASIREMLDSLGPGRTTVDKQIGAQLQLAVDRLRSEHAEIAVIQIDSICRGLATLPPFIPIPVLAAAAGVEPDAVKSFVSDLGRPLWHSDDSVQFRDEPTETWFRKTFAATDTDLRGYATSLEPLAPLYTYAAKSLPELWYRAGDHDRLIELALSDNFLPEDKPIDARDVRIYRLQYAFKTAVKAGRLADASRLAFRTGEEMAGNERQISLLEQNADLMAGLQNSHRVQECAYKRQLRSGWNGSANLFSASLLSSRNDFHGEALNYLHAAEHWLKIHFDERDSLKAENPHHHNDDSLTEADVAEFGWTHLALFGPKGFVEYIKKWKPSTAILNASRRVIRRLIDAGRLDEVKMIGLSGTKLPYLIIAICDELGEISKFPPKESLLFSLDSIADGHITIEDFGYGKSQNLITSSIVNFATACAFWQLTPVKICNVLDRYKTCIPEIHNIANEHYSLTRHTFSKAVTLRAVLNKEKEPDLKCLLPEPLSGSKETGYAKDQRNDCQRILSVLIPLYFSIAKIVSKTEGWQDIELTDLKASRELRSIHEFDSRINGFWDEIPSIYLDFMALKGESTLKSIDKLKMAFTDVSARWRKLGLWIKMTRIAYRHSHLIDIGTAAENACISMMSNANSMESIERSDYCVDLSRAVLAVSTNDASAYFKDAIEAVSKFGDELVGRWEALCAVARATSVAADLPELTYRFFRCAELVGESVGREKYWDRSEVFRIATVLHPPSAISTLSRWRDREIGDFSRQVEALATEFVRGSVIPPFAGFCLSGFEGTNGSILLLRECLDQELNRNRKQLLFDRSLLDHLLRGSLISSEHQLIGLAAENMLDDSNFKALLDHEKLKGSCEMKNPATRKSCVHGPRRTDEERINSILKGLDITTTVGLHIAISGFNALGYPRDDEMFWTTVSRKVPHGKEIDFLRSALLVQKINIYDIRRIIVYIQENWTLTVSVRREWPKFLRGIGKRFYLDLANRGSLTYWKQASSLSESDIEFLQKGVYEGIEAATGQFRHEELFGFVSMVAKDLNPREAEEVLKYALDRFEIHMDPDFGNGPFREAVRPPDLLSSFTGMIWCSLGAPESSTRWEAAHCVRRLVEMKCSIEIEALLGWITKKEVDPFIGRGFPFYRFHAQIFLLFGLARGILDDASLLVPFGKIFVDLALNSTPHAIIQFEAAKIALAIEISDPTVWSVDVSRQLQRIGKSSHAPLEVENAYEFFTSWPEHRPTTGRKFPCFGLDFEAYWLPSLARVFGIPPDQVGQLMRDAAVNDLGIPETEMYPDDPRREIWRSKDYYSRGTSYSHHSYPLVHGFDFYYAYHSFMIAAARLHTTMPMVFEKGSDESDRDPWNRWFRSHQLTRVDGQWLADRRDPTLPSRKLNNGMEDEWRNGLNDEDFFDVLIAQPSIVDGLCVSGSWYDVQYDRVEDVSVDSAFVRIGAAESLANAIREADDPYLCSLASFLWRADYQAGPPFDLVRIVETSNHLDSGIDAFDPFARQLSYPARKVEPYIIERFNLKGDREGRFWFDGDGLFHVFVSETWSDQKSQDQRYPKKSGERVFGSLQYLRKLCSELERDLIISVKIKRRFDRRREYDEETESKDPSQRIFIVSADGKIKNGTKDYSSR